MWGTLSTVLTKYGPMPRLLFEDLLVPDASLRHAHQMYQFLLGQSDTRTSADVLEAHMHRVFQGGALFQAVELGGEGVIEVQLGLQTYHTFSKVSELGSQLREAAGSHNVNPDIVGAYFRPQQLNLTSMDSLVVSNSATSKC